MKAEVLKITGTIGGGIIWLYINPPTSSLALGVETQRVFILTRLEHFRFII